MESRSGSYFYQMIKTLRQQEEIMLYDNILQITPEDASAVDDFLKSEYQQEAMNYPSAAPEYNPEAALWGAKTVYVAAQLILYRENKDAELTLLLPDHPHGQNASSLLSADLCLRFLPDMIIQLKLIDSEDPLIGVLEDKLHRWHYSGIHYTLNLSSLDFTSITLDPSLYQLYTERIIEHKKLELARHPLFKDSISASLGMYGAVLWNDFKLLTSPTLTHE